MLHFRCAEKPGAIFFVEKKTKKKKHYPRVDNPKYTQASKLAIEVDIKILSLGRSACVVFVRTGTDYQQCMRRHTV